jgi:hypothetical protein
MTLQALPLILGNQNCCEEVTLPPVKIPVQQRIQFYYTAQIKLSSILDALINKLALNNIASMLLTVLLYVTQT